MTALTYRPSLLTAKRPLDRRQAAGRFPIIRQTSFKVLVMVGAETLFARVRNLSTHGIGLIMDRPLEPGTTIDAELTNFCKLFASRQTLCVVHATMQADGDYLIGCEFSAPLDHDQVRALIR